MSTSSASQNTFRTTFFITKDTYISNDFDEQRGDNGVAGFIRVGKGNRNAITQTLLDVYDKERIPKDHTVREVELCLYQYFAGSNADPSDVFRVNIIGEDWNEGVVASSKPKIGARIATFYLDSKEGKDCIKFNDDSIDRLEQSFGVIISGGTSSDKKERYFTSSNWLSKSRNVEDKASSELYHPHWIIQSSPNDDVIGRNVNKGPTNYTAIIISCMACLFLSIAGIYYWRRSSNGFSKNKYLKSDSSRFDSIEEFVSIQDAQLQEIFRIIEKNKVMQQKQKKSKSQDGKPDINHQGQSSNDNDYSNNQKGRSRGRPRGRPREQSRGRSKERPFSASRMKADSESGMNDDQAENMTSSSSCSGSDSVNTKQVLEKQLKEPFSVEKLCVKFVHRKECDIDYVAPGVASVVDRQCTSTGNSRFKDKRYR